MIGNSALALFRRREGERTSWGIFYFFFKILFIYFREMGREGEREGEKQRCARDTSIG